MSGAGKTTVTSLLARLYDPQGGRVLVDGEDVKRYTVKSLRDSITFVPQEPMLFRATVAENIAYGKPGAPIEEIEDAARLAGADDFIREMPEGYETLLSERGESLSGGQRQGLHTGRAPIHAHPYPHELRRPSQCAEAAKRTGDPHRGRPRRLAHSSGCQRRRQDMSEDGRLPKSTPRRLVSSGGLRRLYALQERAATPYYEVRP